MNVSEALSTIAFQIAVFVLPFVLLRFEGKNLKKSLGFLRVKKFSWSDFLWKGFALFAFSYGLVLIELSILGFFGLDDSSKVENALNGFLPLVLILVLVLSPIVEELLFRGYVLPKVGIFFSSLVFASLHYFYGSYAEILAAFTLAVCFSYFVKRWNSIYPAIFAHFLVNLTAVLGMFLL